MQKFFLPISLFALLFPSLAAAIVNVEGLHLKEPEPGFSASFDLGVDGNSGNSENFTVSLGSRMQWQLQDVTHLLTLSHEYGESFAEENKNNSFAHARRIDPISAKTAWELFGQVEQDKFARLNFRGLLGSGARFTLLKKQQVQVIYLGVGGFYSREDLSHGLETQEQVRANLYLVAKKQLSPSIAIGSTTYLQPDVEDERDFRALEDAGLSVKINDNTNIAFTLQVKHDNRPPPDVEKTDVSYRTSIHFALE